MDVRAKKALGQHWLADQSVARRIVGSLLGSRGKDTSGAEELPPEAGTSPLMDDTPVPAVENPSGSHAPERTDVLEIGPGMGVLTQYLLERRDINLKMVELDAESVRYLLTRFNDMQGRIYEADYLKLDIHRLFPGSYCVIGNFPYNISSQIFFKILDDRDRVPEVVCMIQKEVAERIAEGPGSKTYGILSVLLQAWYDIEYLFTVEPGAFTPPPKVRSAVIRLKRNGRTRLLAGDGRRERREQREGQLKGPGEAAVEGSSDGLAGKDEAGRSETTAEIDEAGRSETTAEIDEAFFRKVVKTAFGQRRKTLRNTLRPLLPETYDLSDPILQKRAEQLSVEDFIALATRLARAD